MNIVPGLPEVFIADEVRMPKVLLDHHIDINGWHEGNALTALFDEMKQFDKLGAEKYVEQYQYKGLPLALAPQVERRRREGGLELLCEKYLLPNMKEFQSVLDVGSGQGQMGIWFSTAGKGYVGIDISLLNVGFSYAMLPAIKYKWNVAPAYKVMLAEKIEYVDKSFDLVFSSHTMEHYHNFDLAFREQIRLAKKFICAVVPVPDDVESGDHLIKVSRAVLDSYLSKYCESYSIDELSQEYVIWGKMHDIQG